MPPRAGALVALLIAAFVASCAAQANVCNYYSSPITNGYVRSLTSPPSLRSVSTV